MKYADIDTPRRRFPSHISPLLDAMLKNRRTFSQSDSSPPRVTEAIRYESRKQKRIKPYEGELSEPSLQNINSIFDFPSPMPFQLEAWRRLSEVIEGESSDVTASLVTAPTGLGKTEAFLGPLLNGLAEGEIENVGFVYPRTALLRDQLGRILKAVHHLNSERDCDLSVGPYYGDIPFYDNQVDSYYKMVNQYTGELKISECWCGGDDANRPSFFIEGSGTDYKVECNGPGGHTFYADELILSKSRMSQDPPNIFVTTLQSLETSCFKPNYEILESLDAIVVDEIHLYRGIYGSHASRIFRNIQKIKREEQGEEPLFVGSSATLDSPERFAEKMLDVEQDEVLTFRPRSDRDYLPESQVEDYENYYFLLSSENTSLASTFIQQSMLLGHSLLQPNNQEHRNKMLSFIDSISSVNQKSIQFRDADHNRQLWQYHLGLNGEDWRDTATEMENQFIDEPLNIDTDHSDTTLASSDLVDSEVLISTATLEVGIDLGNINVVTQYHAPFNISNFVQRAGRAGRTEGDSHIVTFLARDDSDKNLFNRADRFLDQDVTTPLNPDNKIVDWVHDSLYAYYKISSQVRRKNELSDRDFLRALFCTNAQSEIAVEESPEYPEFYEFLKAPQQYVSELLETGVQNLFNGQPVEALINTLGKHREQMQSEIEPIAQQLRGGVSEILNSNDPPGDILRELRDRALGVVGEYEDRTKKIEQVYGKTDQVENIASRLERVRGGLENQALQDERLKDYRTLQMELREIDNETVQLCYDYGGGDPELTFDIGTSTLERFEQLLNAVSKGPKERLWQFRDEWQATYYLKQSLENLSEYHGTGGTSHESAHAVKHLLRSLYFFDRYLGKRDEIYGLDAYPEEPVYYVPQTYFDPSGSTFTLVEHVEDIAKEEGEQMSEQSLHDVLSRYYPYRTHFTQSGQMEVFQPPTKITETGLEFDFSDQFEATREAEYLRPDAVPLKQVDDCSGNSGQMILNYCPRCYEILPRFGDSCPRHEKSAQGKLFSEPRVNGQVVEDSENLTSVSENLSMGEFTMQLELDGVHLTEHKYIYKGDSFIPWGDGETNEEAIDFPEGEKIGIQLDTRGLIWELDSKTNQDWVEKTLDRIQEFRTGKDSLSPEEAEELRCHTAAHLLTLVVADVAGVKTDTLRYHVDKGDRRVILYEQAEGGQGIVDLAIDELEGNPPKFLESLLRVSYDPSVINRQCWSDNGFEEKLSEKTNQAGLFALNRDQLEDIVEDTLEQGLEASFIDDEYRLVNDELTENVAQEVLSYIDKLESISDDSTTDISDEKLLSLGTEAAKAVLIGNNPGDVVSIPGVKDETIDNLLGKQRPDGCVNTLHLQNCTGEVGDTDQADCLSHILLQTLREDILETAPEQNLYEHIDDTKTLPATTNDSELRYYISF